MSIRFATVEDIPQLQYIRGAVKENILNNPLLVNYNDYVSLLTNSGKGWVHQNGNSITGFAIVDTQKNNVWALFVDPAYEKQGIGRMLHDEMVSWYFENYEQPLWLTTASGTRAEEFYRLSGWKQTGINATNEIIFEITPQVWLVRNSFFSKINTERLKLRPLRDADVHDLFLIRSNPDVNKHLGRTAATKIEDVQVFIEKIKEIQQQHKGCYWIIEEKSTHQFIGTICLFDLDMEQKQGEIGYELLPRFWSKGYMSEAIDAVLTYATNNLGLKLIKGYSATGNSNSNRLLQKKGFKQTASDLEGHDLYLFSGSR